MQERLQQVRKTFELKSSQEQQVKASRSKRKFANVHSVLNYRMKVWRDASEIARDGQFWTVFIPCDSKELDFWGDKEREKWKDK